MATFVGARRLHVGDPKRRGMGDEDSATRAGTQQLCCLRLVQPLVPLLIPPRWDLKSQSEEGNPANDHAFAVKNMDGLAVTTSVPQFAQTVVVARDENCRNSDYAKQVDGLAQPDPLGREIACTHHDIGLF